MKSIKPGRGPSAMGAMGSAFAVIFGIFWTIMAASMGAPVFFPIFGVMFVIMGIVQLVYNYKNAAGKNRYSSFDITDSSEEPDPLNDIFISEGSERRDDGLERGLGNFCPYCGECVGADYKFCQSCGRRLPSAPDKHEKGACGMNDR